VPILEYPPEWLHVTFPCESSISLMLVSFWIIWWCLWWQK